MVPFPPPGLLGVPHQPRLPELLHGHLRRGERVVRAERGVRDAADAAAVQDLPERHLHLHSHVFTFREPLSLAMCGPTDTVCVIYKTQRGHGLHLLCLEDEDSSSDEDEDEDEDEEEDEDEAEEHDADKDDDNDVVMTSLQ